MWPWGHLAVGYLIYSLYAHFRYRRPPRGSEAILVAFGSLLPDIIDKPLTWTFHVLPSSRSLGHSLFTASFIIFLAYTLERRSGHIYGAGAFAIGYLSHLVADGYLEFISGEYRYLTYLVYPILPPPKYGIEPSWLAHIRDFKLTGYTEGEIAIAAFVVLLWLWDGKPGLAELRTLPRRLYRIAITVREIV